MKADAAFWVLVLIGCAASAILAVHTAWETP